MTLVPKSANRKGRADQVVEFIRADSEEGEAINRVLLKETEKTKYKPKNIVELMKVEGYPNFNMHYHTPTGTSLRTRSPVALASVFKSHR